MAKISVEQKLAQIERSIAAIDKTLAINTEHLKEHMRRTAIIEKEMQPVVKHVEQMRGAAKLLGIMALIATIATTIIMLD